MGKWNIPFKGNKANNQLGTLLCAEAFEMGTGDCWPVAAPSRNLEYASLRSMPPGKAERGKAISEQLRSRCLGRCGIQMAPEVSFPADTSSLWQTDKIRSSLAASGRGQRLHNLAPEISARVCVTGEEWGRGRGQPWGWREESRPPRGSSRRRVMAALTPLGTGVYQTAPSPTISLPLGCFKTKKEAVRSELGEICFNTPAF